MRELWILIFVTILISACLVPEQVEREETTLSTVETTSTTTSTTSTTTSSSTTSTSSSTTSSTTTSIERECLQASDCGDNGVKVLRNYTCYNGDIYKQYIVFKCKGWRCIGDEKLDPVLRCRDDERCIEGLPFCKFRGDSGSFNGTYAMKYSRILEINDSENTEYRGYDFSVEYPVSKQSAIIGILLHIRKPDGSVKEGYCTKNRDVFLDDRMRIGIWSVWIKEEVWYAKLWIREIP